MQPLKSGQSRVRVLHHSEVSSVQGHTGPSQLANFHELTGSTEGNTASEVTFKEVSRQRFSTHGLAVTSTCALHWVEGTENVL
jgi:hypothetical protein